MEKNEIKEGNVCPHCLELVKLGYIEEDEELGVLEFVNGLEPYTVDHLQCSRCDSTYIP